MRLHPQIVRSLIAAILAIALAGEARSAAQSPDDTGNPPVLINRPVCPRSRWSTTGCAARPPNAARTAATRSPVGAVPLRTNAVRLATSAPSCRRPRCSAGSRHS